MLHWQNRSGYIWRTIFVAMVTAHFVAVETTQGRKPGKHMRIVPPSDIDGNLKHLKEVKERGKRSPIFPGVQEGGDYKGSRSDPGGPSPHSSEAEDNIEQTTKYVNKFQTSQLIRETTTQQINSQQITNNPEGLVNPKDNIIEHVTSNNDQNNKSISSQLLEKLTTIKTDQLIDYSLNTEIHTTSNPIVTDTKNVHEITISANNSINNSSAQVDSNMNVTSNTTQYSQINNQTEENPSSNAFVPVQYSISDVIDNVEQNSSQTTQPLNTLDLPQTFDNLNSHRNETDIHTGTTTGNYRPTNTEVTNPQFQTRQENDLVSVSSIEGSGEVTRDGFITSDQQTRFTNPVEPTTETISACPSCDEMRLMMNDVENLRMKYNQLVQMMTTVNDTIEEKTRKMDEDITQNRHVINHIKDNVTSELNEVRDEIGGSLSSMETNVLDRIENISQIQQSVQQQYQVHNQTTATHPGIPDLSACSYVTTNNRTSVNESYTYTDWWSHTREDQQESRVASIYCTTYGGTKSVVERHHKHELWQYRCVCTGTLSGHNELRFCELHLWMCPK